MSHARRPRPATWRSVASDIMNTRTARSAVPSGCASWRMRALRGKARVEEMIHDSGLGYTIVRPTVIFGREDILINNIAYILRRLRSLGFPARACIDSGRCRSRMWPTSACGPDLGNPTK
jgi:hypothetical protein